MTAREVFKAEWDFRIALSKFIYNLEKATGVKVNNPIYFDRLLDGDGRQIVITAQPTFDHSKLVVEGYGNGDNLIVDA